MKKKLVIWDFDGVIADSEKIWLKNRQIELNRRYGLNFTFDEIIKYLCGMSDKTKREVLNGLGINTDDLFWKTVLDMDLNSIKNNEMVITKNITSIFENINVKQCIATGGVYEKTVLKLEALNLWNIYFNNKNTFTVDMVEKGKPEPDLFLYAAKKMGEKPEDCIVIEDSIAGLTAAKKANMGVVAFLGGEICQNNNYLAKVKELRIKDIFYDMNDVKEFLLK